MNTFSVVSRVLVVTAIVLSGSVSAKSKTAMDDFKVAMKYVAPIAVRKGLKHQNPYLSAVVEGATVTVARKKDLSLDRKSIKEDSIYLLTNGGARGVATMIAANTSMNEKNFKKACDDYLWESVSEVVKVVAPFGVELVYDFVAAYIVAFATSTSTSISTSINSDTNGQ